MLKLSPANLLPEEFMVKVASPSSIKSTEDVVTDSEKPWASVYERIALIFLPSSDDVSV